MGAAGLKATRPVLRNLDKLRDERKGIAREKDVKSIQSFVNENSYPKIKTRINLQHTTGVDLAMIRYDSLSLRIRICSPSCKSPGLLARQSMYSTHGFIRRPGVGAGATGG